MMGGMVGGRGRVGGALAAAALVAWCLAGCSSPSYHLNVSVPTLSASPARTSQSPGVAVGATTPLPGELLGVAAGSASSAWAVGYSCRSSCGSAANVIHTLVMRWDGSTWTQVPSPSPGGVGVLTSVTAGPAFTAWAVGEYCASGCTSAPSAAARTLILRWNGTAWSHVPSPSPGHAADLFAVSAGPGDTAWAVGGSCVSACGTSAQTFRTLILRWNGTAWSHMPSPSPGGDAELLGVSTGPGNTAWAVGGSCASRCGTSSETFSTLILRWSGTAWSTVRSPSPHGNADLSGVIAGSGKAAWAVGASCASGCGGSAEDDQSLILHWNGASWSQAAAPSPGADTHLHDVIAGPGATAWAVGESCTADCTTTSAVVRTLIMHWNGTAWSQSASQSPPGVPYLTSVSASPGGTSWAVGYSCPPGCTSSSDFRTLILRWNGTEWAAG